MSVHNKTTIYSVSSSTHAVIDERVLEYGKVHAQWSTDNYPDLLRQVIIENRRGESVFIGDRQAFEGLVTALNEILRITKNGRYKFCHDDPAE